MNDLISRQDAIDLVEKWFLKIGLNGDICLDGLRSLPSADVVEVVHGKWIEEVDTMGGYEDYCPINYYCQKCEYLSKDGKTNYCPDCGARMDLQ